MSTVRAKFANGVLEPMERLDLDEGQEVMVSILDRSPPDRSGRSMRAAAEAWKGTHDPEKLKRDMHAASLGRRRPRGGHSTIPLIFCGLVS